MGGRRLLLRCAGVAAYLPVGARDTTAGPKSVYDTSRGNHGHLEKSVASRAARRDLLRLRNQAEARLRRSAGHESQRRCTRSRAAGERDLYDPSVSVTVDPERLFTHVGMSFSIRGTLLRGRPFGRGVAVVDPGQRRQDHDLRFATEFGRLVQTDLAGFGPERDLAIRSSSDQSVLANASVRSWQRTGSRRTSCRCRP
jgi:hypothetical protein